jgi:tRNA-dihydrouridine synthase
VSVFAVHARKAWLSGLSPKENREIPPLDYALVYALKRAGPNSRLSSMAASVRWTTRRSICATSMA